MRKVDVSAYSAKKPRKIKPEKVDLGDLPPLENPKTGKKKAEAKSQQPSHLRTITPSQVSTFAPSHLRTFAPSQDGASVGKQLKADRGTERIFFSVFPEQKAALEQFVQGLKNAGQNTSQSAIGRQMIEDFLKRHAKV